MKVVQNIIPGSIPDSVATIGFFDGVHVGHKCVISDLTDKAQQRGLASLIITFSEHPRKVLNVDYQPKLITTTDEKLALLDASGVDYCLILPFDFAMAQLSASDFMQQVLKPMGVKILLIGYDHHFGKNRENSFTQYKAFGKQAGIVVEQIPRLDTGSITVSSSAIRRFLQAGNIFQANQSLGRAYSLTGTVVRGKQLGRTMGFPTANIAVNDSDKIIPANGVYAVQVWHAREMYGGMLNIGIRPTFGDHLERTVEVNIFDFDKIIYDDVLTIDFVRHVRNEQKFGSVESLREQLECDRNQVNAILETGD